MPNSKWHKYTPVSEKFFILKMPLGEVERVLDRKFNALVQQFLSDLNKFLQSTGLP
jgi:hypothetical protein